MEQLNLFDLDLEMVGMMVRLVLILVTILVLKHSDAHRPQFEEAGHHPVNSGEHQREEHNSGQNSHNDGHTGNEHGHGGHYDSHSSHRNDDSHNEHNVEHNQENKDSGGGHSADHIGDQNPSHNSHEHHDEQAVEHEKGHNDGHNNNGDEHSDGQIAGRRLDHNEAENNETETTVSSVNITSNNTGLGGQLSSKEPNRTMSIAIFTLLAVLCLTTVSTLIGVGCFKAKRKSSDTQVGLKGKGKTKKPRGKALTFEPKKDVVHLSPKIFSPPSRRLVTTGKINYPGAAPETLWVENTPPQPVDEDKSIAVTNAYVISPTSSVGSGQSDGGQESSKADEELDLDIDYLISLYGGKTRTK